MLSQEIINQILKMNMIELLLAMEELIPLESLMEILLVQQEFGLKMKMYQVLQ